MLNQSNPAAIGTIACQQCHDERKNADRIFHDAISDPNLLGEQSAKSYHYSPSRANKIALRDAAISHPSSVLTDLLAERSDGAAEKVGVVLCRA